MPQQSVLIIDDEPDILELLEITLSRMGLKTRTAETVEQGKHLLSGESFGLCYTDMRLPDGSGRDIIHYIQTHCPQTPVAVITAYGSIDLAIESLKAGAFDFISKPVDLDRLRDLTSHALSLTEDTGSSAGSDGETRLLGETEPIRALREQIGKLARSQAPVFITGESGSGKEVVARLIHAHGPRRDMPFVPLNCGAIPSELVESELFGHTKGSFTGASSDKAGLFEAASGGTLFLDEIADLPLAMQVKLLRAIQEKTIRRIGSSKEIPVDVRIISASHKELSDEVERGYFRTDLFYRINVIEVKVPSLRDRREDIPLLAEHILDKISAQWQSPRFRLEDSAVRALKAYDFPGNVRELENIIERAITLSESSLIGAEDLHLPGSSSGVTASTAPPSDVSAAFGDLEAYLNTLERQAIEAALEKTDNNKTEAARLLGISFRQLRYRIKKLNRY